MTGRRLSWVPLCVLLFSGSATALAANGQVTSLDDVARLIADGKAGQAYSLLLAAEQARAGDPQFDYLLGIAANETGNSDEAVLALQRVLLTDGSNAAARIELGRAYFGLGDMALARQEFEQLQKANPPPMAEKIIRAYLQRINDAERAYKTKASGYIELAGGYNSNPRGATTNDRFLNFLLDENSLRAPSAVLGLAAGASASVPVAPRISLLFSGRLSGTNYPGADSIDSRQAAAAAHVQWKRARKGWRVGVTGQGVELDGESNNVAYSLDASGWMPLSKQWLLRGNARAGEISYSRSLDVRDVSQFLYGLSVLRQSPGRAQWQLELSAIGGVENGQTDNAAGNRPFGRDMWGVQLSTSFFINQDMRLFFSAGWLGSDYDGPFLRDSGLAGDREDDQFISTMALVFPQLAGLPNWSIRNELRYIENRSDISLYDYDSFQILITARREFE